MSAQAAQAFGYNTFSCRTGNIYTTTMLRQWLSWAAGESVPPALAWEGDGRWYDPFRPTIEPDGFRTQDELFRSRMVAIESLARAAGECDLFVFTLGLTECWVDQDSGLEYPLCPGVAAGVYDPERHLFRNLQHAEVLVALQDAIRLIRGFNPEARALLSVSPVPLTATYSGQHVAVATCGSKATLRSVAGEFSAGSESIDYFPSFELITSPQARGVYFAANQRSVTPVGVNAAMDCFFTALGIARRPRRMNRAVGAESDVACDEEFLDRDPT